MTTNFAPSQEVQILVADSKTLHEVAGNYRIANADQYQNAAEDLRKVKSLGKKLEDQRKAITGPMDVAKKAVMDFFRAPLNYLDEAETALKAALLTYDREQERLRIEAEAKAAEAARKEQEKLLARADKAAESGKQEKAEALQTQAAMVAPVVNVAPQTKVSGISSRDNWTAEVTDMLELVKAVAAGQQPLSLLSVDQTKLNGMAKALKQDLMIPGVKAVNKPVISARAA